jgi:hypothetical protein
MKKFLLLICLSTLFISCESTTPSITYESVFVPGASDAYFGYHEQQVGNGCSIASATMYLRVLANNSSVSRYDIENTAFNFGYDYYYGMIGSETASTMNEYMNYYWNKTYSPYTQFNGKISLVSYYEGIDINNRGLVTLSQSLSQQKLGVVLNLTAYNEGGAPQQHTVFAYGVRRDTANPYSYDSITEITFANPQYAPGSYLAVRTVPKADYVVYDPATVIYDQRVY